MTSPSSIAGFLAKVYFLTKPYGRRKFASVFLIILAQGIFQVIGVTSIFPFLAMASNPSGFRESVVGELFLGFLPALTDRELLIWSGLFALAMLLASNLLMLAGEVTRTSYSHGFGHWLRLRLLGRIVQNPYGFFLQRNTGELLKKTIGDVMVFIQGVLAPLLEGLARLVTVTFLLLTLIIVDPLLALIAGGGFIAFYFSVFKVLAKRRKQTSDSLKLANRGAMKEAQQLLGGIKPVKVHCAEGIFLHKFGKHSHVQASLQKWVPIYQNSPRYLIEPLAFGGIVVLVLVFAVKGEDLTQMLPTLGIMAVAGYRLIPNFQLLYGSATGITLMMHSLEEVYEEFSSCGDEKAMRDLTASGNIQRLKWARSIRFEKVSFHYDSSRKPVLQNLTLEIKKNEFVAFAGRTGSGKSTLVDLLLGLHVPTGGSIRVDDLELGLDSLRNWRMGIGYVPQDIFLLDESVASNIAFGVKPDDIDLAQVKKVAEVAQIASFIENELPNGYQTQVGERGVRLSGGQRQRIGLARALYQKPDLLILDEATSALDNSTEAALMEAIGSLYGRITLIVIAHRLSTIQKADTIYQLLDGGLMQAESVDAIDLEGGPAGLTT